MADTATPSISLEDKYTLQSGRVYLTGYQALARLPMMQRERDAAAGLDTAGFISGYRGSPLGGLDQTLWKAKKHLESHHIRFQPGVNEDLAATAIWGSQQLNLFPGAKYDGVFGMWYGKGPGVDRCGDVFRHANAAGTSRHGGVLVIAGDDHAARSSTLPHQTDHFFKAVMMPVLAPSGVQDYLDFGIHGWALSRYSGCWVAFKALADTVESSASVYVDPHRVEVLIPTDFAIPEGGLNIRWPDPPLVMEERLLHHKLYAALAYTRANQLNRVIIDSPRPRLGIITSGKSYLDVRQAFDDLGIDDRLAAAIGIRLYKVGMVWPLESEGVRRFAEGLEEILVVEEKRQLIEYQLKEELYNWREDVRPRVIGKFDEKGEWAMPHGHWLLPAASELTPAMTARAIASRIARFYTSDRIKARLAFLEAKEKALSKPLIPIQRIPHFCSGCPHNTSTRLPEGSRAVAGIGCHYMVTWMDRHTDTFTHMGGEGVTWVGQAPFTEERHIFANLGDGTYFHSGLLAIRQAVAAKIPITYKILYNDAVAMTGGQPVDGTLTVPQIAHQMRAEGVQTIALVSDDIDKWTDPSIFPAGTSFHDRRDLDAVQKTLREVKGTSILIYDQTCATEKRRRRKRGKLVDPQKRVMVNSLVCEGCGDCGAKSFCVSVTPKETEYGRKRAINQSDCNKDFSCVEGFCPSFVTVHGGKVRKGKKVDAASLLANLPAPAARTDLSQPWNILITGVGGTGVVTIGALLGMAGHLEGKGATVLDQTGLAQKGGAVTTHIRIARTPADIHAVRIAAGEADLVLGCDMVVVNDYWVLSKIRPERSTVVVNTYEAMPGTFTTRPDMQFPAADIVKAIATALGGQAPLQIDATQIATALIGDAIAANLFILGYAWQQGLVPISFEALMRAIELNGAAIEMNKTAFAWGRLAVVDLAAVVEAAGIVGNAPTRSEATAHALPMLGATANEAAESGLMPQAADLRDEDALRHVPASGDAVGVFAPLDDARLSRSLDEVIARRVAFLTSYQGAGYARRYSDFVAKVRAAETAKAPGSSDLSEAVARYFFKLMAYKDEYEVARLYTSGDFRKQLEAQFEGDYKLKFHLAPPLLAKKNAQGQLVKKEYGPWVFTAFRVLVRFKGLRGTPLDVFGYTAERRGERALIGEYQKTVSALLDKLDAGNVDLAAEIASVPEHIRGFGHVKEAHLHKARAQLDRLLKEWDNPLRIVQAA